MAKTTCEIYLAINEHGGYVASAHDEADAQQLLEENEGGYACKIIKLIVKVNAPVIEEAQINVPDAAGETVDVTAE